MPKLHRGVSAGCGDHCSTLQLSSATSPCKRGSLTPFLAQIKSLSLSVSPEPSTGLGCGCRLARSGQRAAAEHSTARCCSRLPSAWGVQPGSQPPFQSHPSTILRVPGRGSCCSGPALRPKMEKPNSSERGFLVQLTEVEPFPQGAEQELPPTAAGFIEPPRL